VDAGASAETTPSGFKALDPRSQLIVEPVVEDEMAAEIRDDTTTPRVAGSKSFLDRSPRLVQLNPRNRTAKDDQPIRGLPL
jgi:hypothetical protein